METINLEQIETNELLWEQQRRIVDVYIQNELTALRGLNNEYMLNGQELLVWYFRVTDNNKDKSINFDYFKNIDDLTFASDQLLFITGNLFLYRPHINNPLKDGFFFSGKMVYPDYQNMEAARYHMYADIAAQQVYNFWSRVAELINSFFPGLIKSKSRVGFPNVIDAIPLNFQKSLNFQWLRNFRHNEFAEVNEIRKEIVHYSSLGTAFRHSHTQNSSNKEEMTKLVEMRNKWADFYKKHLTLSIEGFEQTLLFLEYMNLERMTISQ